MADESKTLEVRIHLGTNKITNWAELKQEAPYLHERDQPLLGSGADEVITSSAHYFTKTHDKAFHEHSQRLACHLATRVITYELQTAEVLLEPKEPQTKEPKPADRAPYSRTKNVE